MSIPNEIFAAGGNQQPNPESAPTQINNLNDAGKAFLDSLGVGDTGGGTPPDIGEILNDQEGNLDNPAEGGAVVGSDIPPVVETSPAQAQPVTPENNLSLDEIKNAILSEIRALQPQAAPPQEGQGEILAGEQAPEIDITDDAFMEEFGENPVEAVKKLADRIADQKVAAQMSALSDKMKPLLDQSEQIAFQQKVRETLSEFAGNPDYADAEKYFPQMAAIMKESGLPQDNVGSYETAYLKAALQDARTALTNQPQNQGKTLEEYLADENSVSQITANPQIQKAIIEGYLNEIAAGGKPQVITSGGSASPVATPPTKINSLEEAGKAFRKQLG